jgi:phosphoribosyl-AMP cyclohydrolase
VSVIFSAPSLGITNAAAQAVPLTSDTGYFWFFSSNNIELVIKAVDGRAFNQHYWVFYGALSDVQYTITVTDTVTGAIKTYSNAAGHLASVADVVAFPGGAAGTAEAPASAMPGASMPDFVRAQSRELAALVASSPSAVCLPDATTLCLNGSRFQVRVSFNAPSLGITNGSAQAVPLTADTGYMWFFSANNVELMIKVVDGRAFNQFFWVFYGALSDVEYTITVTDSETGAVKTYHNAPGTLASVADVAAFR